MASADSFNVRLGDEYSNELAEKIAAIHNKQWRLDEDSTINDDKAHQYVPAVDQISYGTKRRRKITSLDEVGLKRRLVEPAKRSISLFDRTHASLSSPIFNYHDLLFPSRTPHNASSVRDLVCLHALNHVFKTRDRVIKTNERLSSEQENVDLEVRDQGFTRPKVLILLPTRKSCTRYMDTITRICDPEQQENRKRFQEAFAHTKETYSESKPLDFRELFDGNTDDNFRLGIKLTRKTIRYYSQFYSSDIILASPLGLRQAIKSDDPKKSDHDFLSSIEILLVDQADALLMQNWEHTLHVLEHLNLQPRESHGCDFSRVRKYYLDQQARYFRQTIVFSAYLTPEINGLFSTQMQNIAGKVKISREYSGAMLDIGLQIRQIFIRFGSSSPVTDPDDRFKYFTSTIIPMLEKQPAESGLGVLVYIPSYFDFVRVRNHFDDDNTSPNLSWSSMSEFDDLSDVRRARSHFFTGRNSVLLYSGRLHHYHRYQIRGVKRVVLYGVPENPLFYTELVGEMLESAIDEGKVERSDASVRALFSKWDALALERIVGSERAKRMLKENRGDTFDFR